MMNTKNEDFGFEQFPQDNDGNYIIDKNITEFTCPWLSSDNANQLYKEISHEFVLKKILTMPDLKATWSYNIDFLLELFTQIFAHPDRPVRYGKVSSFELSGRAVSELLNSLAYCGYFKIIIGNEAAGHKSYTRFWYPTLSREIKKEIITSVVNKKNLEISKLNEMII